MRLVTWDMAVAHIKEHIPEASPLVSSHEADIRFKIEMAEEIVLDHVNQRIGDTAAEWSETVGLWNINGGSPSEAVPARVSGCVLMLLKELMRFRGDDMDSDVPRREIGMLNPLVVAYLFRLRDPAIA